MIFQLQIWRQVALPTPVSIGKWEHTSVELDLPAMYPAPELPLTLLVPDVSDSVLLQLLVEAVDLLRGGSSGVSPDDGFTEKPD